jgi:hypothetical protein
MKILVPPGANGMDLNGDGRITPDELIRSTWTIFVQVVLASSAAIWCIWIAVAGRIPNALTFLRIEGVLVTGSIIAACYIGIKRQLRYERQEGRDYHMWLLEKEKTEWQLDQAKGISKDSRPADMTQIDIDAAALTILTYYYDGKDCTREALVQLGLMTADLWNSANKLLKDRHIRKGRSRNLEPGTFEEAWAMYLAGKMKAHNYKMAGAYDPDWRENA